MKNLTPAKVTMLMFVAVGGLVVAYVAKTVLARAKPPEIPNRMVPMPVAELQPGTIVTAEHLGRGPFPENRLERDMLLSNAGIVGRVVKEKLTAATPIRGSQLYAPGETMPLRVQRGMRAISVSLGGKPSLVDGLVKPGDYVDVHFYPTEMRDDPRIGHGMSVMLLEGVKILAINRAMLQGQPDRDRNVVTLELTPEQAGVMNVASQRGQLSLSFNPQGKGSGGLANKITNKEKVTIEEILDLPPVPKPEDPVPLTSFYVEQWRGAAMTTREFGAHNSVGLRESTVQPRRRNNSSTDNPPNGTNTQPVPSPTGQDLTPQPSTNDSSVPATDRPQPTDQPANSAPATPGAVPPTAIPNVAPIPNGDPNPNVAPTPGVPASSLPTPPGAQGLVQPPGQPTVPIESSRRAGNTAR